jgi:hypothetical protein
MTAAAMAPPSGSRRRPGPADLPRVLRHATNRVAAPPCAWAGTRGRYCGYLDLDLEVDVAYVAPPRRRGSLPTRAPGRVARSSVGYCHFQTRPGTCAAPRPSSFFRRERLLPAPHIEEGGWFFDTEVMMVSALARRRIAELPVDFTAATTSVSTVKVARDVRRYLGALARSSWRRRVTAAVWALA